MNLDTYASRMLLFLTMGIVTAAVATALAQHGGWSALSAVSAGMLLYAGLICGHLWSWRRSDRALGRGADPHSSKAEALARSLGSAKRGAKHAPFEHEMEDHAGADRLTSEDVLALNKAQKAPASQRTAAAADVPEPPQFTLDDGVVPEIPDLESSSPRGSQQSSELSTNASERGGDQSPFDFRPAEATAPPSLPPFVKNRSASAQTAVAPPKLSEEEIASPVKAAGLEAPPMPPQSALGPREADVEMLQGAIKRLLQEVNEAELAQQGGAAADGTHKTRTAAELFDTDGAIDQSVDALNLAAGAMRDAGAPKAAVADTTADAGSPSLTPPPLPPTSPASDVPEAAGAASQRAVAPSDQRAQIMSDAISAGRISVLLQPILGLEDQRTRHYEVSVQLRDAAGDVLDVFGRGPDLRGTGLLPLFDSVSVAKIASVSRRLSERGKSGSIFSRFNGESIADDQFIGTLANHLRQQSNLAAQLVLSFSQADVRALSPAEWDSLADMRALGFRFAISSVTDLDMDFEALAEQGFAFAKLDADVFLNGLRTGETVVPSKDVCAHLAKLGLTLVVENIADERQRAMIFGFGVLLGQGELFGGPRPVRADPAAPAKAAVA